MDIREKSRELHLPAGIAYTCHSTGVCCNVFENIPVDNAAGNALSALDHRALNRLAGNRIDAPLTKSATPTRDTADLSPTGAGAEVSIARKACGSCAMLTPDNLCAIHALGGEKAKPQPCQDFPWRFVETPGGVYVGLSFVCPSVRANRGQWVHEQGPALQERYTTSASVRSAPGLIPLNVRRNLSWNDYLHVEEALVDLMNLPQAPLTTKLIACSLLPGFIDQILEEPSADIPKTVTALRAAGYSHILNLARKPRNPAASRRPRRMFLGMFTSFANTLHRREGQGRLSTVVGVLNQYVRAAAGLGAITLQPVNKAVSHSRLDQAHIPDTGDAAAMICRYITHCIVRKDLTLSGDINRRMRMLAINAALIAWYATALADADAAKNSSPARPEITERHWDEAIGLVERLYGFHSIFYQFFERNRTFSDIVDTFILKPSFPFTLLR